LIDRKIISALNKTQSFHLQNDSPFKKEFKGPVKGE
jgi:hypothetical protein